MLVIRGSETMPLIDLEHLANQEGADRSGDRDDQVSRVSWYAGSDESPTFFVLAVPVLGAIIWYGALSREGIRIDPTAALVGLLFLGAWTLYLVAWVISRVAGERRIGLFPDHVWLPATNLRLVGRSVPFQLLEEVSTYGPVGRYLLIRFANGARRYRPNQPAEIRDALVERAPRLDRR